MTPVETNNKQTSDDSDIIKEGDYVIIKMPSGGLRVQTVRKSGRIHLGKFGSFESAQLIGKYFDAPYEIYDRGLLRMPENETLLDSMEIDADENASNQHILDDKTAQKLSATEIQQMKEENMRGDASSEQVIKTLVENSKTFDQKTEFAKAKYIKKKERKYTKVFVPMKPSIYSMCEYYFSTAPQKTMELRVDTLSQILSFGNIHANSKIMVLDDTQGLLLASVLERTNGLGTFLCLHNKDKERYIICESMNFRKGIYENCYRLPYSRIQKHDDEDVDVETLPKVDMNGESWEKRNKRIVAGIKRIQDARNVYEEGNFDGIVMAIENEPMRILEEIKEKLGGGRPIVIYNQFKEMLLECFHHMRHSKEYVNVQLTESWMRQYQVPLHLVGTHPHMSTSGSGGYILSATKVFENENVIPFDKYDNKLAYKKQRSN